MRRKFTEEQIAFALKQAEHGTPVAEVIRKMGITEQTCCRWNKKYGGLGMGELRRLKQLEEENRKLKRMDGGQMVPRQTQGRHYHIFHRMHPGPLLHRARLQGRYEYASAGVGRRRILCQPGMGYDVFLPVPALSQGSGWPGGWCI